MKPQHMIHERQQSHPALCQHRDDCGIRDCWNECRLIVTRSPLMQYDYLIVDRCVEHLNASYGVVFCEIPTDDEAQDISTEGV